MNLKSKIEGLPWISAAVGIFGTVWPFLLPSPASWGIADAWATYLIIFTITAFLLVIAYFDWKQEREGKLPSVQICTLISHLSHHKFSGQPTNFNKSAEAILLGEKFSDLLPRNTDYYSQMMSMGLIALSSITETGNNLDGTSNTIVNIYLTEKAQNILRIMSNE